MDTPRKLQDYTSELRNKDLTKYILEMTKEMRLLRKSIDRLCSNMEKK